MSSPDKPCRQSLLVHLRDHELHDLRREDGQRVVDDLHGGPEEERGPEGLQHRRKNGYSWRSRFERQAALFALVRKLSISATLVRQQASD